MKKLLLIGGTGFVGNHIGSLFKNSHTVVSTGSEVDIRSVDNLYSLIENVNPDLVINLAAITTIKESFEDPYKTYNVNFLGTLNLLSALRRNNFSGRLLFISSSEVYGLVNEDKLPIYENTCTKPVNPYAVSKVASESLCYQWNKTENFEILIARPFNHIGPGQSDRFSISNFGKQVAKIKLGIDKPIIKVGDVSTVRDFTDVRDVANAYKLLLTNGNSGDIYNICSNNGKSIEALLIRMAELFNLNIELQIDDSRLRVNEQRIVVGSNTKLIEDTGWMQKYSLDETLKDIVNYWIDQINGYQ